MPSAKHSPVPLASESNGPTKQIADRPDLSKIAQMVEECACLQLRKATRVITQLYDGALRPSDVLITQLPILATLSLRGPTAITILAEELVMDRSALARNLKPLLKRRLIEIVPGKDQRTREVTLTETGQDALARAIPLWQRAQDKVVEGIGDEQLGALQRATSAVLQGFSRS